VPHLSDFMKIALDTNSYVDFCKGIEKVVTPVRSAEKIYISFIVLAELRAGFLCSFQSESNERNLSRFLNTSRVSILYADEQTTHHYAKLFLQLRKQGTPIPTNDLWIAALAVQYDLILCSRDSHFDHLAQIPRI